MFRWHSDVAEATAGKKHLEQGPGLPADHQILAVHDHIRNFAPHEQSGRVAHASRHMPVAPMAERTASFDLQEKKAVTASKAELARNPRARSAKLRWAVRTAAPAVPFDAIKAGVLPEVRA